MSMIEGVIEAVRKDGKGFKVGEAWYGVFDAEEISHVSRGDTVRFDFTIRGNYNNIKGTVEKVSAAATPVHGVGASSSAKPFDVQAAIIRQNALTNAVNYTIGVLSSDTFPDIADVIKTAQRFEEYTSGRLDTVTPSEATSVAPIGVTGEVF
ncbi:MAG: hypothetical protein MN733_17080 [Nitrososphaera sp.]|nr:hypothetical protein [Nitrososphaera sp.]